MSETVSSAEFIPILRYVIDDNEVPLMLSDDWFEESFVSDESELETIPAPPIIPQGWVAEVAKPTPKHMEIVIDMQQVDIVLGTLLDSYENNTYPYNQEHVRLPHDKRHMPESLQYGSRDHANVFMGLCAYMRGGIKSVDACKRISKLYDDRPDLFRPEIAMQMEPTEIAAELRSHGLGFQKTVSKQWVENSKRLTKLYDGDPRKIFDGINSYEECLKRLKNDNNGNGFIGFQEKMASMLTYYLMDSAMIEPFMFPIPVDLHVMRVSIANRMVTFPGVEDGTNVYTPELLATLRTLYVEYAINKGVNPLRLCDAVWLMSESSCGKNPGNITLEPFGRGRRDGRSTLLMPKEVDITSPAQHKSYDASCRSCPLDDHCQDNIPGKPYYVAGTLMVRGRRVRFPFIQPKKPDPTLF